MPVLPLPSGLDADDARLRVFSRMTDSELKDPKQLVGLERAIASRSAIPNGSAESLSNGLFIAESAHVIERALDAGLDAFCLISENRWSDQALRLMERTEESAGSIPLFVGSHEQVSALTGYERLRGPLAAFHRPAPQSLDGILARARRIAVLEDVTNYTNLGAIFRSAAALGIDAVLTTPCCYDPLYRRAARVSMGTVFQVPWGCIAHEADWAAEGIPLLRRHGFATAALALREDSMRLQDPRIVEADKLALVLGTEGEGLRSSTIEACDFTVMIPMMHGVDSLNVAATAAIAFWETCGRAQR